MTTTAMLTEHPAAVALERIQRLAELAMLAPSGDNLQPWRLVWNPAAQCLCLQVDAARDRTVMNTGGRMARIACGAALENIHRCVAGLGLKIEAESFRSEESVELYLSESRPLEVCSSDAADIELVRRRVTNRKLYDGRVVSDSTRCALASSAAMGGGFPTATRFVFAGAEKTAATATLAKIDGLTMALKEMRECLVAQIRFGNDFQTPAENAAVGLPVASLELNWLDRCSLRLLKYYPEWAMRSLLKSSSERYPRQRLESSSGLCIITAPRHLRNGDLLAGRAFQRAWLSLTALGLSVQPMMAVVGVQSFYRAPAENLIARLNRWGAPALVKRLNGELGLQDPSMEIAGILRFGFAPAPTARAARLSIAEVLTVS